MLCGLRQAVHPSQMPSGTIEIWRFALTTVAPGRLPAGDEAVAARFQQADAAGRWRSSRLALRHILGWHCGLAAGEVPLLFGQWGKPFLTYGPFFNLSTAGNQAVIVVRRTGEVGIDLQTDAVVPADLQMVSDQPLRLACASQPRAHWARLEAVLKCRGQGFSGAVPAELIAALTTTHGQVQCGGHSVWWSDQPHACGALCIAADAPWKQLVEHSLSESLQTPFNGMRSPSVSRCPPRDRAYLDR